MQFRSPNLPRHEQPHGMLGIPAIAEEIFRKSLNTSYIGQMSGQKEQPHQVQNQPLFSIPEEPNNTPAKRRRIDFSRFRGEAMRETVISNEDMQFMFIRSFSKGGDEKLSRGGCMEVCHGSEGRVKCLLQLLNESTLQIYTMGDKLFDQLFASINFDTVTVGLQYENIPQNRQIGLTMGPYRLLLEHDKRKIVQHWHEQINKMHAQSKGRELPLTKILDREEFYSERFETEEFFTKNCETGDVILFQDNHFFAKAQRLFTRSNFDHVGMVVKDTNYGLLIFEANSGSGVGLTPWRSVIRYGWYRSIPKIAWRRLKVNRTRQFNETVQKFVMENLRKNYHISFAKITAHESVIRPIGNPSKGHHSTHDQNDQSGFFCSELVATVYKELGLLTRDKSNENYQPAYFSQRSGRKLDQGELSPQYTIYFDKALLKLTYKGIIHDD